MDDLRPLLLVNKDINERISRWHYRPILGESEASRQNSFLRLLVEKPHLIHIIKACIFSLEKKTYETGLAKLLRDPTLEMHVLTCLTDDRFFRTSSEWLGLISHLYSLLSGDRKDSAMPWRLINREREGWASELILKDGRISMVTVNLDEGDLKDLTPYLEAMPYLRVSLEKLKGDDIIADVLRQLLASPLLSRALVSVKDL